MPAAPCACWSKSRWPARSTISMAGSTSAACICWAWSMRTPIRARRPSSAGTIRARCRPPCSRRRCRSRSASCRRSASRAAPSTWSSSTTRAAAACQCSSSTRACRRNSATCTGWWMASIRMPSPLRWPWATTCARCRAPSRRRPWPPAWCGACSAAPARRGCRGRRRARLSRRPFLTRRWSPIRWPSRCSRAARAGSIATATASSTWGRRIPTRWRRARRRRRRSWAGRMRRTRRMPPAWRCGHREPRARLRRAPRNDRQCQRRKIG